jgi:hypothetical protein
MGVRTTSYHRSNGHSYRRSPSPDKKSYHRRHHHHRRHDYSSRFVCFLLELLNSYKIKYSLDHVLVVDQNVGVEVPAMHMTN